MLHCAIWPRNNDNNNEKIHHTFLPSAMLASLANRPLERKQARSEAEQMPACQPPSCVFGRNRETKETREREKEIRDESESKGHLDRDARKWKEKTEQRM